MNTKNKKLCNLFFNKLFLQRGIALLFSMMLSAVFLSIAIGVLNISTKELNFTSSIREANNAFFAADSGVECTLFNDRTDVDSFKDQGNDSIHIKCFNNINNLVTKSTGVNTTSFSFNILGLGTNLKSCAKITLVRTVDNTLAPPVTTTKITSKGYNTGGDTGDCSASPTNRVERQIEVNY